jgi:DNA-binding MarR family transcriptional regulator
LLVLKDKQLVCSLSRWGMADMENWSVATDALLLATQLTEAVHEGVVRRGFREIRPAHGFAFARISAGDATIADVAEHLGITKQAAAQLVHQLEERGYVTRKAHPLDARASLLALTKRGVACTLAAQEAASEAVEQWRMTLGEPQFRQLQRALRVIVRPGPLRPNW